MESESENLAGKDKKKTEYLLPVVPDTVSCSDHVLPIDLDTMSCSDHMLPTVCIVPETVSCTDHM